MFRHVLCTVFVVAASGLALIWSCRGVAAAQDGVTDAGGSSADVRPIGGPSDGAPGAQREYVKEAPTVEITQQRGGYTTKTTVVVEYGLRIEGYVYPSMGLVVQNVVPGGPGTHMWANGNAAVYAMERGDVLESVNGQRLNTASDYFTALRAASVNPQQPVSLAVRDINNGGVNYFFTRLGRIR